MIYHVSDQPFTYSVFHAGTYAATRRSTTTSECRARSWPQRCLTPTAVTCGPARGRGRGGVPVPGRDGRDYRDEEATRHAFRYGWFHSGDSCAYDEAGLRIMLDRYKDIVKTAGRTCPACGWRPCLPSIRTWPRRRSSAAAPALERGGDRGGGAQDGAEASEEDLVKHCRASLSGYETPKSVVFAADLPETVAARCSSTSCARSTPGATATSARDRPVLAPDAKTATRPRRTIAAGPGMLVT